ncbi:MAG TPA: AraC family transcriptional regulator [Thermoanaerobaculia bacterium]|nr:AraC family transcriptional regulator [Thermoanaerobaculia bacterium]
MDSCLTRAMTSLLVQNKQIESELESFRRELRRDLRELPHRFTRVVQYVQDHLFDPSLNVSSIKRHCRIRDNNFSILFRSAVGVTPRVYIEALRIDAADYLLKRGDFEVYLIAMAVGYSHQETFFRAFHRRFGCPPSNRRYRSMGGRKDVRANCKEETES